MHIGICLFTAGVVLCAIALPEFLSKTSQKAKIGIIHIIRLQKNGVSSQYLLSAQSVKILKTSLLWLCNQKIDSSWARQEELALPDQPAVEGGLRFMDRTPRSLFGIALEVLM